MKKRLLGLRLRWRGLVRDADLDPHAVLERVGAKLVGLLQLELRASSLDVEVELPPRQPLDVLLDGLDEVADLHVDVGLVREGVVAFAPLFVAVEVAGDEEGRDVVLIFVFVFVFVLFMFLFFWCFFVFVFFGFVFF